MTCQVLGEPVLHSNEALAQLVQLNAADSSSADAAAKHIYIRFACCSFSELLLPVHGAALGADLGLPVCSGWRTWRPLLWSTARPAGWLRRGASPPAYLALAPSWRWKRRRAAR